MLKQIQQRVEQHTPREMTIDFPEAAVLMPITQCDEPNFILTLRSDAMPTHRGEVAFPGGRRERADSSLIMTALRESEEEIGLDPNQVSVLGHMDQVISRYGFRVTPVVGFVPANVQLQANTDEITSMFEVPLDFFMQDQRLRTDRISFLEQTLDIPCYLYNNFQIWGLTALMIVEFLNITLDAGISLGLKSD